jgi:group I intron endonuclease
MKNIHGVIYLITNTVNGKPYVGQARSLWERWNGHCKSARSSKKRDRDLPIHRALRKYGEDKFTLRIIERDVPTAKQLNKLETVWVFLMNSKAPNGYNLNDGGGCQRGWKPSKETRRKIGDGNRGKYVSPEVCQKISDAGKGRVHSETTKRKMSRSAKRRYRNHPEHRQRLSEVHTGKMVSPETCEKIRLAKLGTVMSEKVKRAQSCRMKGNQHAKGYCHTQEFRQGMSTRLQGNSYALGNVLSAETRKRMSAAHKGISFSEEHKQHMRKPRSEETKRRMRKPKSEVAKKNMCQGQQERWDRYHAQQKVAK